MHDDLPNSAEIRANYWLYPHAEIPNPGQFLISRIPPLRPMPVWPVPRQSPSQKRRAIVYVRTPPSCSSSSGLTGAGQTRMARLERTRALVKIPDVWYVGGSGRGCCPIQRLCRRRLDVGCLGRSWEGVPGHCCGSVVVCWW